MLKDFRFSTNGFRVVPSGACTVFRSSDLVLLSAVQT